MTLDYCIVNVEGEASRVSCSIPTRLACCVELASLYINEFDEWLCARFHGKFGKLPWHARCFIDDLLMAADSVAELHLVGSIVHEWL